MGNIISGDSFKPVDKALFTPEGNLILVITQPEFLR